MTTEQELIRQCRVDYPDDSVTTLVEALECYYMNGNYDDISGDVDAPTGHFYRIERWLVRTNDRGFTSVETFNHNKDAIAEFEKLEKDYGDWDV